jgi:hypothetical protein
MAKIESLIPESGVGFVTNNRTNNSHFATEVVHDLLIKIAGLWHENHADHPISIGQLSHKGGGSFEPSHHQHQHGIEADMRPLRKDGQNIPTHFESADYSRELTREFVKLLRKHARMHRVWFNDPQLIKESLTTHMDKHGDHLHCWFEDSQKTPVLRKGNRGDDVRRLQEALIAAGFPMEDGADGGFGTHTQDAVRAFQTANPPLSASGIADEATLNALGL